ncbi:MAG TPA: glycosyltransferase family 2 protein [Terriglobia bacterium]|jgi:glycosyltransferase involved in cell wall biosynthesis
MRCPQLADLPPVHGKRGWPWSEETLPAKSNRDPEAWPRVTIVTPSFNQGIFLEETIRSVLLQGYSNLEYIIMDGGSKDSSVDIIKKYASHLSHWTSHKDGGAADAIRRGFERATGQILAYLNSDDVFLPGAIHHLVEGIEATGADVVYGNTYWTDQENRVVAERRQTPFSRVAYFYGGADMQQPSTFWKSRLYREAGGMDASYQCAFDTDLFAKFASKKAKFSHVRHFVSCCRLHSAQKTEVLFNTSKKESDEIRARYTAFPVRSLAGMLIRNFSRLRRMFWYLIQGDAIWLLGRIPDRLKSRTGAATGAGPRSRWF